METSRQFQTSNDSSMDPFVEGWTVQWNSIVVLLDRMEEMVNDLRDKNIRRFVFIFSVFFRMLFCISFTYTYNIYPTNKTQTQMHSRNKTTITLPRTLFLFPHKQKLSFVIMHFVIFYM